MLRIWLLQGESGYLTLDMYFNISPRENDPRFFEKPVPDQVAMPFESFDFGLIESVYTDDGLDRDEIRWVAQVYGHDEVLVKGSDQII